MDLHGFGALVKGTGIRDWVLDGFLWLPSNKRRNGTHWSKRYKGETPVTSPQMHSSGVDFILWFMPLCPPFFSSSFYSIFTCVFFFFLIKLFYSLICMKEHRHGLQGEREMTWLRLARGWLEWGQRDHLIFVCIARGATGHLIWFFVCIAHGQFSASPFF